MRNNPQLRSYSLIRNIYLHWMVIIVIFTLDDRITKGATNIKKTYKTGWLCSDSCITKITHDIYLGTQILMLMLNIIKYLLVFPCEIY